MRMTILRQKMAVLVCLLAFASLPVWGQYFERNKIQYGPFDFSVLKTEHFQIFHYPKGAQPVMDAARILEAAWLITRTSLGMESRACRK